MINITNLIVQGKGTKNACVLNCKQLIGLSPLKTIK